MNKLKQGCIIATLGLLSLSSHADSDLQIKLDSIKIGDTQQKVLAIFGQPACQEAHKVLGMACEQLTFKKPFSLEVATITFCFKHVVATKYAAYSLLGL